MAKRRKEKTRDELDRELRFIRTRRLVDGGAAIANNVVRYGGMAVIAYFAITRPIEALAGRVTLADIRVLAETSLARGSTSSKAALVASWALTLAAIGYGYVQRKLRRDAIERLSSRVQMLEKQLDPGRTSSTLSSRGDTRKEDET